jgi:hypothetical protein
MVTKKLARKSTKRKSAPKDKVVFRMFNGEVIALFPEQEESRGNVNSYMHIGQHGGANYNLVMSKSKKATPSQYKDLKAELKSIGYKLDVKQKYIQPRRRN